MRFAALALLLAMGCNGAPPVISENAVDRLADLLEAEIEGAEAILGSEPNNDLAQQLLEGRSVVEVLREFDCEDADLMDAISAIHPLELPFRRYLERQGLKPREIERRVRPFRISLNLLRVAYELRRQ